MPFANGPELGASTVTALVSHAGAFSGLVPLLPADQFFDNRTVTYTGALVPAPVLAAVNANVDRFDASPAALNHMEHFYQPTGALTVPVLMLSSSRDPVVPGLHQRAYRELVTARRFRPPRSAHDQPVYPLRFHAGGNRSCVRRSGDVGPVRHQAHAVGPMSRWYPGSPETRGSMGGD